MGGRDRGAGGMERELRGGGGGRRGGGGAGGEGKEEEWDLNKINNSNN